jgi:hypothetical protein
MFEKLISHKAYILSAICALSFLAHLPFINIPPSSVHAWRQCNTLAVARNFAEEEMDIFHPRIDRRFDGDGITGMQFPSYEFGLAILYKIFGVHEPIHRVWSFIIYIFIIWGCWELLYILTKNKLLAFVAAWIAAWAPELFYWGWCALPDPLALGAAIWALACYYHFRQSHKQLYLLCFTLLLTLAGLTKIQYLLFGALAGMSELQLLISSKNYKRFISFITAAMVCGATVVAWYIYANELIHQSNLRDFVIQPVSPPPFAEGISILWRNYISDLPESLINYGSFALVLLGIFSIFKKKENKYKYFPWLLALLPLLVFHIIELTKAKVHLYYLIPYFLFLLVLAVKGFAFIYKKNATLAKVILIAMPILCTLRILPARWIHSEKSISAAFGSNEERARLERITPPHELCIVGPDISGCILFYMLHKKGFGFDETKELENKSNRGKTVLEEYIIRGAHYLYTSDASVEQNTALNKFINKKLYQSQNDGTGHIYVYELKK